MQSLMGRWRDRRAHILRLIECGAVCAEVGVWKGEFSQAILRREPAALHLIDPWLYMPQYTDRWYGGNSSEGGDNNQGRMDRIYNDVVRLFSNDSRVHVHRSLSEDAARLFSRATFDFVYIDANHSYEFVKRDLELFLPQMKQSGFLTGDDYVFKRCPHGGPKRAVDELVAAGRARLESVRNNQFVLRPA